MEPVSAAVAFPRGEALRRPAVIARVAADRGAWARRRIATDELEFAATVSPPLWSSSKSGQRPVQHSDTPQTMYSGTQFGAVRRRDRGDLDPGLAQLVHDA
jgi:hypothetical protein